MRLRPLNDTVIIECDMAMMAVDNDQIVLDVMSRGIIALPEKNMLMKLSNKARVISYGPDCHYKFKSDQEIIYDQFADTPVWAESDGRRCRIIKYHYVHAVYE